MCKKITQASGHFFTPAQTVNAPAVDMVEALVPNRPTLTADELAEITGLRVQSLASMRMNRKGCPFIRCGRAVRYPRTAVVTWLSASAVVTSDPIKPRAAQCGGVA